MKIGNVEVGKLVEEYGTPLYVYDAQIIRERVRQLKESFTYKDTRICYSCKANSNIEILKLMKDAGIDGIDTVSVGEAELALRAGFPPEQISITNVALSNKDMDKIRKLGIRYESDSISQLKRWGEDCWIRINPGIGFGHHEHVNTGSINTKFGVYPDELEDARSIAKIKGLHQHAGCGVLQPEKFLETVEPLLKAAKDFPDLEGLNVGGGLGVPYEPDQKPLDVEKLGKLLSERFETFCEEYGRKLELCLEPGRFIVAESGYLLATVNTIKESPVKKFALVDTGFHHLLRPILYDAYHEVINTSNPDGEEEDIWLGGNVCEAGDLLTEERKLPKIREGDVLAFKDVGAYGYVMASNYMSMKKPAEVLVDVDNHRLITRRE